MGHAGCIQDLVELLIYLVNLTWAKKRCLIVLCSLKMQKILDSVTFIFQVYAPFMGRNNPLHPFLHTVLHAFLKVLTRRICLTITICFSW